MVCQIYVRYKIQIFTNFTAFPSQAMTPFWNNALHWLDQGRKGVVGVVRDAHLKALMSSGLKCESTFIREDLSVYVCTAYSDAHAKEIQDFVAQGGGLLIGGHAWYWAQRHSGKNVMKEFSGMIFCP